MFEQWTGVWVEVLKQGGDRLEPPLLQASPRPPAAPSAAADPGGVKQGGRGEISCLVQQRHVAHFLAG